MDNIIVNIILNGNSSNAKRINVEGDTIVKLSSFATENSGFNWQSFIFMDSTVILDNVVIYDDYDLKCLTWFLFSNFNVDMTKSYIGFEMLKKLALELYNNDLLKNKRSLKLTLPWGGGSRESEILEYAKECFDKKGVKY